MFEHRKQPLQTPRQFLGRVLRAFGAALTLVAGSLVAGMAGYHVLEGLGWVDAFLNASMILGGMGPVNMPVTESGKLFAGLYALYCGLAVIVVAGILLAPLAHRMLHRFHVPDGES